MITSSLSGYRGFIRKPATELWICYSSISYYLFVAWHKSSSLDRRGFLCYAPGSPLYKCHIPNDLLAYTSKALKSYHARNFILLAFTSILGGRRLVVRVPHLNAPIINKTIERLALLSLIRLDLYDDGFLGILDRPSVCNYLKPIFRSVCSWNISGWKLSKFTLHALKSSKVTSLDIQSLPCTLAVENLHLVPFRKSFSNVFIVEAKYMDYQLLSDLLRGNELALPIHQILNYYQHPWSIKQNRCWPPEFQRNLVSDVPLETHLASLINQESHVITAMTSSVIFLCELVRQGVIMKHRITLLLRNSATPTEYHNESEPHSFISFIQQNYQDDISLSVWLDGTRL